MIDPVVQPPSLPELTPEEMRRYSRHLLLPQVGLEGQRRLKAASVVIVGVGGLGSAIAMYLAAAGVGRIGLVDDDVVDESNLQRQVIHGQSTLGELKVISARQRMLDINPYITVDVYPTRLTSNNAMEILRPYDIIVDGTDNIPTRYLLNDAAVLLGKPYVYGSIYRFEGQVSVFYAKEGPCYRCLFPEPPPPHLVPTCGQGGVIGVLPGTIGTLQATEVIKLILGIGQPLIGRLLLYDALDMSFDIVRVRKNPKCPVCGERPTITTLQDYDAFCGLPSAEARAEEARWEIGPRELAQWLAEERPVRVIDIREPHELAISRIPAAENVPYNRLLASYESWDRETPIVLVCRTGNRSAQAARVLREAGFQHVWNLRGGINAWAREVDPSQPEY
ncbi:MAG: molybdopterin-synthase adenylyltransferase MoeB [Chloroflexi bacterium]|nr:molybdopterin-synthase adenylyltransferase MoeB [Chloroflexota bacterium]